MRNQLKNKREWQMSHLLSLIAYEEITSNFSELTKRIYSLERRLLDSPNISQIISFYFISNDILNVDYINITYD